MSDKVPMGNIVDVNPPSQPGSEGHRNPQTLRRAFSQSPIYRLNDQIIKEDFENWVMKGNLEGNEGKNGSGFGFSRFNRDFVDAPNIPGITKDNDGREIVSPYAPNIASPNEDGEQEELVSPLKGAGGAFRGDSLENPKSSSARIGKLTLGSYGLGTSKSQSNGTPG